MIIKTQRMNKLKKLLSQAIFLRSFEISSETESSVSSHLIAVNVLAAVGEVVVVAAAAVAGVVVAAAAVVVAGAAAPALVSVGWCCVKPIRLKD